MTKSNGLGAVKTLTVICWAVTALALVGLVFWIFTGSLFGIDTGPVISFGGFFEKLSGPYVEQGDYTVPSAGVERIFVDWTAGDVTVVPYDGDVIRVAESAQRELSEEEGLYCVLEGNTLKIKYRENRWVSWWKRIPKKKLALFIPEGLAENLELLQIDSISGDIRVSDITAETLRADSTSGDVKLSGIAAQKLDVDTVSGSIAFQDTSSESVKLDSISGGINIEGSFRDVTASSTSGSVKVKSSPAPDSLKIDTISGAVTISVPETRELTVGYDSVSGKFSSDFPVSTGGKTPRFRIDTVSGSIKIKTYEGSADETANPIK